MLPETRRAERGHDFYPPARDLATIPPLYATEDTSAVDKAIVLHYFIPGCDTDWWIVELDPATGRAFGYARLAGDDTNAEFPLPPAGAGVAPGRDRADPTHSPAGQPGDESDPSTEPQREGVMTNLTVDTYVSIGAEGHHRRRCWRRDRLGGVDRRPAAPGRAGRE